MATPILPVVNFGQLTPAQVSPMGGLTGAIFGAAGNIADLKKRQALLEQLQQQNQARPAMQQAQLASAQQRFPLMQAQTGQIQERTRLMPQAQDISAQRAYTAAGQLGQSQTRFGPFYQLTRFIKEPFGQKLLSKNPEFAKAYGRMASNTATIEDRALLQKVSGINMQDSGPQGGRSLLPGFQSTFRAPTQDQGIGQPISQQQPMPPPAQFTKQEIEAAQEATANALAKKITPPPLLKRQALALSASEMYKAMEPNIALAVKYAGLKGKSKLALDKIFNKGSQQYKDYIKFTRVDIPTYMSEVAGEFGKQATDAETRLMQSVGNPITWDSTPDLALDQLKELERLRVANMRAISKGVSGIQKGLKTLVKEADKGQAAGTGFQAPAEPLTIPAFNDKGGFDSWYASLSGQQKVEALKQMRAK